MTRVLFVDDEPVVLRAIERVLRVRRVGAEARFAGGGEEALALLAREPFDVIVSDLSMPAMDGVTLLGIVRERHPHVARLVLSGLVSSSVLATQVAHQWFSKPCDMSLLMSRIERIGWLQSMVEDPALRARIGGLAGMPSPFELHVKVTDAIARDAPHSELVALVRSDPAVVAKLLQFSNSAFFGEAERVVSITRALAILGTGVVRETLTTNVMFRPGAGTAAHHLFVATLARTLAPAAVRDDAFVAGLLHDFGDAILAELPTASSPHDPVLHARVGALLLGLWGLPSEVVDAIAFHHDPDAAPAPGEPTLRALALAEALAAELDGTK